MSLVQGLRQLKTFFREYLWFYFSTREGVRPSFHHHGMVVWVDDLDLAIREGERATTRKDRSPARTDHAFVNCMICRLRMYKTMNSYLRMYLLLIVSCSAGLLLSTEVYYYRDPEETAHWPRGIAMSKKVGKRVYRPFFYWLGKCIYARTRMGPGTVCDSRPKRLSTHKNPLLSAALWWWSCLKNASISRLMPIFCIYKYNLPNKVT